MSVILVGTLSAPEDPEPVFVGQRQHPDSDIGRGEQTQEACGGGGGEHAARRVTFGPHAAPATCQYTDTSTEQGSRSHEDDALDRDPVQEPREISALSTQQAHTPRARILHFSVSLAGQGMRDVRPDQRVI